MRTLVLLLVGLVGCSDPVAVRQGSPLGRYGLVSVNGGPLPTLIAAMCCEVNVVLTGATLRVGEDSTFTDSLLLRTSELTPSTGTEVVVRDTAVVQGAISDLIFHGDTAIRTWKREHMTPTLRDLTLRYLKHR